MRETKRTVKLDCGLSVTVDLDRANTPEASLALYQNDRENNPLGMIRFLTLALGESQRDLFVKSLQDENGNPGSWDDFSARLAELFEKLKDDGKKS